MRGIRRIDENAFCGLSKVKELDLPNNQLTEAPNICPLKCSIKELNLDHNKISMIGGNYFTGSKKLRSLHLENNAIRQIPDLHWIHHLVEEIYLSYNMIKKINISIIQHMPRLDNIDIDHNQITQIDDYKNYDEVNISLINVEGNPWHCGPELSWMGEEDDGYENGLLCASPICLLGTPIAAMGKIRAKQGIDFPREQGSCGQHWSHLGPVGPMWALCWPHEPCYLG